MARQSNGWKRPDMLQALKFAASRLTWHVPGCKGGDFHKCRCSNAVAVRRLDIVIKAYDDSWTTQVELAAEYERSMAERDAQREETRARLLAKRLAKQQEAGTVVEPVSE